MNSLIWILVVEDDDGCREAICHALKLEGYNVEDTGDAALAINMIALNDYDVVITDYHLSGGAVGLDVIKAAREYLRGVRIIMMSGEDAKEQALFYGADAFIRKPVDSIELCRAIRPKPREEPREGPIIGC